MYGDVNQKSYFSCILPYSMMALGWFPLEIRAVPSWTEITEKFLIGRTMTWRTKFINTDWQQGTVDELAPKPSCQRLCRKSEGKQSPFKWFNVLCFCHIDYNFTYKPFERNKYWVCLHRARSGGAGAEELCSVGLSAGYTDDIFPVNLPFQFSISFFSQ